MKKIEIFYRYLTRFTRRFSEHQLMLVLSLVVGLVVGTAAVLFEIVLHFIKDGLTSWFRIDSASVFYLIYPVIGIILATLFVRYIVRDQISEGVMRVLYAMSRNNSRIKPHNCYSSMVASATTIGFGGSVGPEAPIVLTGAAIGSNIGSFMRQNYRNTTLLIGCGAAAAVATIFKAPITGVVFVLEILMLDLTAISIIPLLIAAVTGTSLMFFSSGFDPIFSVYVPNLFALEDIPFYIILGALCGLVSYYFVQTNEKVGHLFAKIKSMYLKWLMGGLLIGGLIFLFPPLYAEGYNTIQNLMRGDLQSVFDNSLFYAYRDEIWIMIVYMIAILLFKVVAMSSTNAAGGVGGGVSHRRFLWELCPVLW